MQRMRKNGSTSNIEECRLLQDGTGANPGYGKTGLSSTSPGLVISTKCDNELTETVYTQAGGTIQTIATIGTFAAPSASNCRFKEVDSTNSPGKYQFMFADARYAVSGAKLLTVTISGVAGMIPREFKIQLTGVDVDDGVRGGMTAFPNVAQGNAGAVLTAGTGTAQLNVSSGNLAGAVPSVTGSVGSVTGSVGSVTGSVGSISGITFPVNFNSWSMDSSGRVLLQPSQPSVTIPTVTNTGTVTGNVNGSVASVTGNVGGNVVGSTGSVIGSVGSVAGSVGSVAGGVGGDVSGKVLGGGSSTISGDGVRASSVSGSVASVAGSVGSVTGSVGSVAGNVSGDVAGKVLGGGASSIAGAGVRADAVTGSVGSVVGSVGSVAGSVGSVSAGVTVATNNDKSGYSLTVSPPTASVIAAATAAVLFVDGATNPLKVNMDNSVNTSGGQVVISNVVPPAVAAASQNPQMIAFTTFNVFRYTLTMGNIASRTGLWFCVKGSPDDPDSAALILISELGGLLVANGAVAANPALGSLSVVDSTAGTVNVYVNESITGLIAPTDGPFDQYYWDAKVRIGTDTTPPCGGRAVAAPGITRAY